MLYWLLKALQLFRKFLGLEILQSKMGLHESNLETICRNKLF